MQLIGLLIFIGILVLLLAFAIYLARGEKYKNKPYGSWSNVLGPQFRGSASDVREKLKEEMVERGQPFQRRRRPRHSKDKKK